MACAEWSRRRAAVGHSGSRRRGRASAWGPFTGVAAQGAVLAALWAAVGLGPLGWWSGTAFGVLAAVALYWWSARSGRTALGAADRITHVRLVLTGGVVALAADGAPTGSATAALVLLAATAVVLDGVDGLVARRTHSSSAFGARFDMETDALLILVLSLHVATALGAWVALIGLMRYAFGAAGLVLPELRAALPPSTARKAVAALQGVVLTAASAPVWPPPLIAAAVALALTALMWSFARDVAWLLAGSPWRLERREVGKCLAEP